MTFLTSRSESPFTGPSRRLLFLVAALGVLAPDCAWCRDGSPSTGSGAISLLQVKSTIPTGMSSDPTPDAPSTAAAIQPAFVPSTGALSVGSLVELLTRILSALLGSPVPDRGPTAGQNAPPVPSNGDDPAPARSVGNGPAPRVPREVTTAQGQGKVTTRDPRFAGWLSEAVSVAKRKWKMPDVVNRYGEKISQEDFLLSILWLETRGVHGTAGRVTTSPKGAVGFMQLMPAAAKDLGMSSAERNDPRKNLVGGATYLEKCFNDGPRQSPGESGADFLSKIAASYNAGPYLKAFKTKSWQEYVGAGSTEATRYGIGMKMCLGLEISAREKQWYARQAGKSVGWVDQEANRLYSERRGLVGGATQLARAN